jgi:biopolymer transport protein ExbB
MSKGFMRILLIAMLSITFIAALSAQEMPEQAEEMAAAQEEGVEFVETEEMGGLEMFARRIVGSGLVDLFVQGGFVMWPILLLVIWGLATIIWKIISLSYARINVNDFMEKLTDLLKQNKIDEAVKLCENTRGPVATILHRGLLKADQGVEAVEKEIENAGTMEMAFLEKGFIPLSTTINLAPMFGFFGTIVGMIAAFDAIARAGEVDPTIVASGIKIALVTTAAGLAVAIPVQFFNNIFLGMVDSLVMDMQKGSERLIEVLMENNK